jgi:hypothetical protein
MSVISILPRFDAEIGKHLLCNLLNTDLRPITLGIFGRPGDGKSAQLAESLAAREVTVGRIVASHLESSNAGEPGRLLATMYRNASAAISDGVPAALVIDDIDTTVGEWAHHTGTVNHLQVLAELMHIADRPIDQTRGWMNRVPVFVTGNNLGRLYPPLRRPGRMCLFDWRPTAAELTHVAHAILDDVAPPTAVGALAVAFRSETFAFFAEVRSVILDAHLDRMLRAAPSDLKVLLKSRDAFAALTIAGRPALLDETALLALAQAVKTERSEAARDNIVEYAD